MLSLDKFYISLRLMHYSLPYSLSNIFAPVGLSDRFWISSILHSRLHSAAMVTRGFWNVHRGGKYLPIISLSSPLANSISTTGKWYQIYQTRGRISSPGDKFTYLTMKRLQDGFTKSGKAMTIPFLFPLRQNLDYVYALA